MSIVACNCDDDCGFFRELIEDFKNMESIDRQYIIEFIFEKSYGSRAKEILENYADRKTITCYEAFLKIKERL